VGHAKHVADRHQAALHESQVADRCDEGDVLEPHAFPEEADQGQREECAEENEVERLRAENLAPALGGAHYLVASGGSSCLATMPELSRMARAALLMVIEARDTASTSPPTRNGSRNVLPLNCAANFGGWTEK